LTGFLECFQVSEKKAMLSSRIVNSLRSSKRKLGGGWLRSYDIATRGYVKSAERRFKDRLDSSRRRTGIPGYGADPTDDATRYVLLRRVSEEVYESQLLPDVQNAAGFTAVASKTRAIDEGQGNRRRAYECLCEILL